MRSNGKIFRDSLRRSNKIAFTNLMINYLRRMVCMRYHSSVKKVAPVDAGVGTANRSQETLYFNKTEIKIVLLSLFVKLSITF